MSDAKIVVIKLVLLVLLWVTLRLAHKLNCAFYRWRTSGWIPLDKDTVWMSDAGYKLEFPPSPVPVVLVGVLLSVGIVVLR